MIIFLLAISQVVVAVRVIFQVYQPSTISSHYSLDIGVYGRPTLDDAKRRAAKRLPGPVGCACDG